jgi:hypothetical protein
MVTGVKRGIRKLISTFVICFCVWILWGEVHKKAFVGLVGPGIINTITVVTESHL